MKHIINYALLLFSCIGMYAQEFSPAKIDSLRRIIQQPGETVNRLNALNIILNHFGMMPNIDSVLKYSVYGLENIAKDSIDIYTVQIYKNYQLASAWDYMGRYSESLVSLLAVRDNIRLAKKLVSPDNSKYKGLSRIEKGNTVNTSIHYSNTHQYDKADSCLELVLQSSYQNKDILNIISILLNRASLYSNIASYLKDQKDSTELLLIKSSKLSEESLQLARAYLAHVHPPAEEMMVLRFLMYILTNKANVEFAHKKISLEEKNTLLAYLLEAIKLAQSKGYPGYDILICKSKVIMLYRLLGKYEKAYETADSVIAESERLQIPLLHADGYLERSYVHWNQNQDKEAIQDVLSAEKVLLQANQYWKLTEIAEGMVQRIDELPRLKRYKLRRERARFEVKANEYRQKAKEAGQEVSEPRP